MRLKILAAVVAASATFFLSIGAYCQGSAAAVAPAPAASPVAKELERGYSLKDAKRSAEAIAVFEDVLKKDPSNHSALSELGYLNANRKFYKTAAKYLAAASAQEPGNMQLHMDLAYAYQSSKQNVAANKEFKIVAASSGPLQGEAKKALTIATVSPQREQGYAALKTGDKAAALKAFEAAVASDPKDAVSLKQLGFINLDGGNPAAAAAHFEAVLALDPSDYSVALQLGYTYDSLHKKEQSRKAFGAALASPDPKVHDAAHQALQSAGGEEPSDQSASDKSAPTQSVPANAAPAAGAPAVGASL
jgi:tetratricopeptide (TPR) repeat protein